MSKERNELYEFGDFRLNPGEHRLERLDGGRPAAIPEKAFRVLCLLVENRGHLLTKRELIEVVWPDSFVEENNLDKCIHVLRHTFGEHPGEGKYIETVRKHGYRFVAEVKQIVYTEPRTESGRYIFPKEVREISLTGKNGFTELEPIAGNPEPDVGRLPSAGPDRSVAEAHSGPETAARPKANVIVISAAVVALTLVLISVILMLLG